VRRKSKISVQLINAFFAALCVVWVIPILYIVSISFTRDPDIIEYGYRLIPKNVSFTTYGYLFQTSKQLLNSYAVSLLVTGTGTALSLCVTTMLGYALCRPDFAYRRFFSFIVFFTMLFNGGLVPTYILITRYLHLKNNILVLILPYVVNAWFVLLMRSFLTTIPLSLVESAKIDGASELRTFAAIVLPLSKPALATIGLLIAFNYWNDWWLSLLYIDVDTLIPLQFLLYRTMSNIMYLTQQMSSQMSINIANLPTESARMAMCILAAGPMLVVFPFFQKYFVKGITLGAVKG
jgi:putative aldouronate transport system permease protein